MNRLKNKKSISKLFDKTISKSVVLNGIRIVYYKSDESAVMVTASSSIYKRAVDRNKIKRCLRDSIGIINGYNIGIIYFNSNILKQDEIALTINKLITKIK